MGGPSPLIIQKPPLKIGPMPTLATLPTSTFSDASSSSGGSSYSGIPQSWGVGPGGSYGSPVPPDLNERFTEATWQPQNSYCRDCAMAAQLRIHPDKRLFASNFPQATIQNDYRRGDKLNCAQQALVDGAKRFGKHRNGFGKWCSQVVSNIIQGVEKKFPNFNGTPWERNDAVYQAQQLANDGYEKLSGITNANINSAPPGTIVIFNGNNNRDSTTANDITPLPGRRHRGGQGAGNWVGHIAIRGDDGFWYADGRTRMATFNDAIRPLRAAFIPGQTQIAACSGK
jgi:hypothetical protein